MNVCVSSGLVDRPFDRLYVRTIPMSECMDRRFRYSPPNFYLVFFCIKISTKYRINCLGFYKVLKIDLRGSFKEKIDKNKNLYRISYPCHLFFSITRTWSVSLLQTLGVCQKSLKLVGTSFLQNIVRQKSSPQFEYNRKS